MSMTINLRNCMTIKDKYFFKCMVNWSGIKSLSEYLAVHWVKVHRFYGTAGSMTPCIHVLFPATFYRHFLNII